MAARGALREDQIEGFRADGYVRAGGAVTAAELASLRDRLAAWSEEARRPDPRFEATLDGRPRIDCEAGADGSAPALRRVNNPAEISEIYRRVAFDSAMVDMASALVGPDLKFHHCKINLKQPRSETRVGWHQDFPYTPHTNPDMVEALLLLDDMDEANGCLQVVPGSHREGAISLWSGDRFTGEIAPGAMAAFADRTVPVTGRAGEVCLMHPLLVHGSEPNRSTVPRALFICVYSAADAFPLAPSPLPNRFEGRILRGQASRVARLVEMEVELPAAYDNASFFQVQEGAQRDG